MSAGFDQVEAIRYAVFSDEQGLDPAQEIDEIDETALHALLFVGSFREIDGGQAPAVGTGRLFQQDGVWRIGRISVLKDFRGDGYGEVITRMLCGKAFELDPEKDVVLHAHMGAVDFYKKIGFQEEGEVFFSGGRDHLAMRLREIDFRPQCGHDEA